MPRSIRSSRWPWWCPDRCRRAGGPGARAGEFGVPVTSARRRHLAGRSDRRRRPDHRLFQASGRSGRVHSEARTVWVEPGVVLDRLNRLLRPHGLFFPVDISTGSRATLGGMAANNACACARSATASWSTTCWRSTACSPTARRSDLILAAGQSRLARRLTPLSRADPDRARDCRSGGRPQSPPAS